MIYFIQSGPQGPIKIGTCKDGYLQKRLAALQTGNPNGFTVLGIMDGGVDLEGDMHKRFRAHRRVGEWFAPATEILSFIDYHSRPFEMPKKHRPCLNIAGRVVEALGGPFLREVSMTLPSNPFTHISHNAGDA